MPEGWEYRMLGLLSHSGLKFPNELHSSVVSEDETLVSLPRAGLEAAVDGADKKTHCETCFQCCTRVENSRRDTTMLTAGGCPGGNCCRFVDTGVPAASSPHMSGNLHVPR
jgi:hypothetical protein